MSIRAVYYKKTSKFFMLTMQKVAAVFEKTCEATQKNVKSHVFWILKKKR